MTRNRNFPMTNELLEQIKRELLSGVAQYKIAKKYGVPPNRISKINRDMRKKGEKL